MSISAQPANEKATLRAAMLACRNALTAYTVRVWSAAITETVMHLPAFKRATTLCCYLAIGNEVQTIDLIRRALADGKRVALPRTLLKERRLALHQITTLDNLIPGRYGIMEPGADAPLMDPAEVELFLIPGAVFDVAGHRLGYGAGLYDTLLAGSRGCRVALAYNCQLAPCVAAEPHDIPMQFIVTECGVIECRNSPPIP